MSSRPAIRFALPAAALALVLCAAPSADALDPGKAVTQYMHDAWRPEQGLPQSSVLAIEQARDGYLWLGTQEGLVRFDGVRFTVYDTRNTPEMAHNLVRALHEDGAGRLWVGTDGGLLRLEGGRFTRYGAAEGLPHDVVASLAEDGAGRLFVGTWAGVARVEGSRVVRHEAARVMPGREVRALAFAPDGALWIGTEAGLGRLHHDALQVLGRAHGFAHRALLAIHRDDGGQLWIGTEGGGVYRVLGERVVAVATSRPLSNVVSLHRDGAGNLWVGTEGDGLVRVFEGRTSVYGTAEGLTNATVAALLEDREGNLWVGTHGGGLNRLRDARMTPFTTREGLSNDNVVSLLEGRDGVMWIGTYGGGLNRLQDGRVTTLDTRRGLVNDFVLSLLEDRAGTLWIGTNAGLGRLSGGRLTHLTLADGLTNDSVHALLEDREGTLWIGTNGGVNRLRDGRLTAYTTANGLTNNSVWALHEDEAGTLWIATMGGLNRLRDGKLTALTTRDGLARDAILSFHEDADGALWVGTHGGGLSRVKDGRVASLTARQGLFEDSVFRMLEDAQGNLWMSSNKGISRVPRRELEDVLDGRRPRVHATSYGIADGMRIAECNGGLQPAGWKARDGRLWFPTVRGAVIVDPADPRRNTRVPPVVVEELIANGERVDPSHETTLPPGTHSLEVHYTALSLRAPERVRFRVRLEGFDPGWVDVGTRRTAYYTNLPPGPYTFRVVASNDDGVWNEQGAALALRLEPRLHQKTWFHVLCGLIAAGVLLGAWRVRLWQLRSRERELLALVDERTHSLRVEKERAEAATREAFTQRQIAVEADALKTELLAIAAHDLKNPLQSIVGAADLVRSGMAGHEEDQLLESIHRSGGRMVRLIDDLLTTAALDVGRLELKRTSIDLRDVVREAVADTAWRAEVKHQQIVVAGAEPCRVHGDVERLREVLDNLLSNAVKFSPTGATVWVEMETSGDVVQTRVRDSGPGLSAEDLARAFDKFQRLSAQPTAGESSTGLGLSIVRRLVELHGGRVRAESEGRGRGATFVVELPREG